MAAIECELKSFLTPEHFDLLHKRLEEEGEFLGSDEQVTYYFKGPHDLRIQRNGSFAKVCLKKGAMHDEAREEIEIQTATKSFEDLDELFRSLGYEVSIEWYRTRNTFRWKNIDVMLDHTRGYGYIIELEKLSSPEDVDASLKELHGLIDELGVKLTPKEEFRKRFDDYRAHWKERIAEDAKEKDPA